MVGFASFHMSKLPINTVLSSGMRCILFLFCSTFSTIIFQNLFRNVWAFQNFLNSWMTQLKSRSHSVNGLTAENWMSICQHGSCYVILAGHRGNDLTVLIQVPKLRKARFSQKIPQVFKSNCSCENHLCSVSSSGQRSLQLGLILFIWWHNQLFLSNFNEATKAAIWFLVWICLWSKGAVAPHHSTWSQAQDLSLSITHCTLIIKFCIVLAVWVAFITLFKGDLSPRHH